jgi:xanthine dehydrogenase accessory factor
VNKTLIERIIFLQNKNIDYCLVTQIEIRGSAPQNLGAKIIVTESGLDQGTIGGGKIENHCIKFAQELLKKKDSNPSYYKWNLQKDIGMSCGGEVTILFEPTILLSWPIVIFGAGHVSQALSRVLSKLKCHLICIDSRAEWIEKLQIANKITHHNPSELVANFDSNSFFLSMTMGHAHDVPILFEIFKHHPLCPYVGVIGSEIKGKKIKAELKQLGCSDAFIQKLKVPMGLPIGNNDPEEIAISIAAQLIQSRDEASK